MEFDSDKRRFQLLQEVTLAAVPTAGDKVILNLKDEGFVFKVYDVHYADEEGIDVNVIRLSSITEYCSSKYPDIV